MLTRFIIFTSLLSVAVATKTPAVDQTNRSSGPTLVVLIVIDQMRADYLTRYERQFSAGLKRLLSDGAVFERGAYPYLATSTCPGHATIGTGALPATHGIIANEWWSAAENRRVLCTDDATVTNLSYIGGTEKAGHSARRLKVPTLGDRLKAVNQDAQVVTLSMKPRSAIMLAGKSGTSVTWFVDATNGWATSTAYTMTPVPAVRTFLDSQLMDRDRSAVWTQLAPSQFSGSDDAIGERPKPGWTASFPHPLAGAPGTADTEFNELWKCSPFADAYLADLAIAQTSALRLGQRTAIDLLGVGFSGLDCVGHDFGPDSAEVHDTLLRLDLTLGRLFDALDRQVGRNNYVVGLSADHGVSPIPEQRKSQGGDAGRVMAPEIRKVAEAAMVAAHGQGPHVASVVPPYVSFTAATRAMVEKSALAAQPAIAAVSKMPGILRVMPGRGLESRRHSADLVERAAALSYFPAESGDLVLALKPYWINGDASAASHGTLNGYDQQVPVILMGPGIKGGRYTSEASPADIVPTLAAVLGLNLTGIDGKALTQPAQ